MGQESIFETLSSIYHAIPMSIIFGAITGFLSVFFFFGAFAPGLLPVGITGINDRVARTLKFVAGKSRK